jgi:hypothetical protein
MTCVPGYLSNPPRIQGLPDSAASHNRSRLNESGRGGVRSSVYNVEFVRQLCREINAANGDAQKEKELLSLLRAVFKEDHEEVRIRVAFLLKKYGNIVSDARAAD